MNKKPVYVAFANKKIEQDFERLKEEKFEDKQLYTFIQRAIDDLKKDPMSGTKMPKSLWFEPMFPFFWRIINLIRTLWQQ